MSNTPLSEFCTATIPMLRYEIENSMIALPNGMRKPLKEFATVKVAGGSGN
jgi:hypothetical protein